MSCLCYISSKLCRHLAKVEIINKDSGVSHSFPCHSWLQPDKKAAQKANRLSGCRITLLEGVAPSAGNNDGTTYEIVVCTSGDRGSGTDSCVQVLLFSTLARARTFAREATRDAYALEQLAGAPYKAAPPRSSTI